MVDNFFFSMNLLDQEDKEKSIKIKHVIKHELLRK